MQDNAAEQLTQVLLGKAVRRIEFVRENEVCIEFSDNSRLSFNSKTEPLESSYSAPGVKVPGT